MAERIMFKTRYNDFWKKTYNHYFNIIVFIWTNNFKYNIL